MKYLDLTLRTPEANLACDEALLDSAEAGHSDEVLRFWESPAPFVVVGYSNRVEAEVNVAACRAHQVPILRRCSGGGTVVQGPGCLNYSLILRIEEHAPLATISGTNRFVMEQHREAIQQLLGQPVIVAGHTDLALCGSSFRESRDAEQAPLSWTPGETPDSRVWRKFSGNAQRRKREFLIFHGTFLVHLELAQIETLLRFPSKAPEYRDARTHEDFVINLELPSSEIQQSLKRTWGAGEILHEVPWNGIDELVKTKYSRASWNFKF